MNNNNNVLMVKSIGMFIAQVWPENNVVCFYLGLSLKVSIIDMLTKKEKDRGLCLVIEIVMIIRMKLPGI